MSLFVLNNTNKRFRALLDTPGPVVGSIDVVVTWAESGDNYFAEDSSEHQLTTAGWVDVVTPPSAGRKRVIKSISMFNTAIYPLTVTLAIYDGSNTYTVGRVVIPNGSSWSSDVTTAGGTGITDGLKGDINVSGNGASWAIVDGAVTKTKLADESVDSSKIAPDAVTNDKLLNDSVTIAGNSVALGGSVSRDQVTGLSADGIVKRSGANNLTQAVAGTDYSPALVAGSNVTLTPTVDNKLTVSSTAAGVTNGDKGDITVTNAGTPTENWAIDPRSVTYNKIEEVAGSRLLGRSSSTPGDIQEIELGTGLSFNGNTLDSAGGGRPSLNAPRNYFVAPATGTVPSSYLGFTGWVNGSDSNNGLSQATPFASIQKAIDTTNGLDTSIYEVNIYVCKGTYRESLNVTSPNLATSVWVYGDTADNVGSALVNSTRSFSSLGAGAIRGAVTITRSSSGGTNNSLNISASTSGTPNFVNMGWQAGDRILVLHTLAQGTFTGSQGSNVLTLSNTSGLVVGDYLLLPSVGVSGVNYGSVYITAINGNQVTIAKGLGATYSSATTLYRIVETVYTLTNATTTGNLIISGTWPDPTNNGFAGYTVVRLPNVTVQPVNAADRPLVVANSRSYGFMGFEFLCGANGTVTASSGLSINTSSYAFLSKIVIRTHVTASPSVPAAAIAVFGGSLIMDWPPAKVGGVLNTYGQLYIGGTSQYSISHFLLSGSQLSGIVYARSNLGPELRLASGLRGNGLLGLYCYTPITMAEMAAVANNFGSILAGSTPSLPTGSVGSFPNYEA